MFRKNSVPVLVGIIVLSGMFLVGQEPNWPEPEAPNIIFITASPYNGNLGLLYPGSNQICQDEANAAGLTGTFQTWLSDAHWDPYNRVTEGWVHSSKPYELVDGTRIADDWYDLTSGSLQNPINRSASGLVRDNVNVWTNTHFTGQKISTHPALTCDLGSGGYTSADPSVEAWYGRNSYYTDERWTKLGIADCDQLLYLYCVQQQPE